AHDTDDTSCGGQPGDNNVYGEGRLSAYGAVAASPRGATGVVTGTVTDATSGEPIAGARVEATSGTQTRRTSTDADGRFRIIATAGTVGLRYLAFGYLDHTVQVDLAQDETETADVALARGQRFGVTGTVRDPGGAALGGIRVGIPGSPLPPALTGDDGRFTLADVPAGTHTFAAFGSPCSQQATRELVVDGDEDIAFTVTPVVDARGYHCRLAQPGWLPADTVIPISGDVASANVDLPFVFWLYGKATRQIRVSIDGRIATDTRFLSEDIMGTIPSRPLPDGASPGGSIYPFWTDLLLDAQSSLRTGVVGTAPHRSVVVEWREAVLNWGNGQRITAQAVLGEDGGIRFQYAGLDTPAEHGAGVGLPVAVGIADERSATASQFLFTSPQLDAGVAIVYRGPATGAVLGTVVDGVDGRPIDSGRRPTVTVRTAAGAVFTTLTPDSLGRFGLAGPPGDYTATFTATNYTAQTVPITLGANQANPDLAIRLATGKPSYSTWSFTFMAEPGGQDTQDLVVTNVG
ncbi:MAG TPA: carboxypeptidase-like regulatory domain-containing protein, partial [Micromonospora sp.]